MNEIKISYEGHYRKSHTLRSIAESLNRVLSCSAGQNFFCISRNYDDRIEFSHCANTNKHNKLIAIVTLWFCDQGQNAYTAFYNPPYFCISDSAIEEFGDFVESLPKIEDVKIKVN